jgi:hypothetical protein
MALPMNTDAAMGLNRVRCVLFMLSPFTGSCGSAFIADAPEQFAAADSPNCPL